MTHVSGAWPARLPEAERRCFPRFNIALVGVCSINQGPDAHCASVDLSIAGIAVRTRAAVSIGDAVIASFREFGMAKGRVVRRFGGGFAFALNTVDPYRSRLSQYLRWWVRGLDRPSAETRLDERLVPLIRLLVLTRADGRTHMGRVKSVSRSGIVFTSTTRFSLGEAVRIGRYPARVVRVGADVFAADFESVLTTESFDVMISFADAD
jgi:hypothetical protein